MILSKIITINYKSCKNISINLKNNSPNIFIGMNDCGKTSLLQSLELLLSDTKKPINYAKNQSAKSDLSHTPIKSDLINKEFEINNLPSLPLDKKNKYIIVAAKFQLEDIDSGINKSDIVTPHLKWLIYSSENRNTRYLWIARVFNYSKANDTVYYLTLETESDEFKNLYSKNKTQIKNLVSKYNLKEKIAIFDDKKIHFESIKALYSSTKTKYAWSAVENKNIKKDRDYFPIFSYLDWNQSVESITKMAKDILTRSISEEHESAMIEANKYSRNAQDKVNKELEKLGLHNEVESIKSIHANIFFKVNCELSDLLIQKNNSESKVHIDSQGEGIKRQLWFSLLKSQAENNVKNSRKKLIWCFDEPETHLHPKAQREFFSILKSLCKNNFQILISTHSTIFVDSSNISEIHSFNKKDNYTNVKKPEEIIDIHQTLGIRNSDFLFYDKFIIVEGETEESLIPYLYELYTENSLEEDNIQLIVLDGCTKSDSSEKILKQLVSGFSKLSDTAFYILDNDARFSIQKREDERIFLIGKQDIEDSIPVEVWKSICNEKFGDLIDVRTDEILDIIDNIPSDRQIPAEHKFQPKLKSLLSSKLQDINKNNEIKKLQDKGNEWGKLIAKHIKSKEQIPSKLCEAFDRIRMLKT